MGIANKKLLYVKIKYRMSTGEPNATMFQFPSMMRWSLFMFTRKQTIGEFSVLQASFDG